VPRAERLSKHNPAVDWKNLRLTFDEDCRGRCLPPQATRLTAPRASTTPKTQFHARVEDAKDEGEPEEHTEVNVSKLSAKQRAARSRRRRDWRHRQQWDRTPLPFFLMSRLGSALVIGFFICCTREGQTLWMPAQPPLAQGKMSGLYCGRFSILTGRLIDRWGRGRRKPECRVMAPRRLRMGSEQKY
jgi:hypothetical protein